MCCPLGRQTRRCIASWPGNVALVFDALASTELPRRRPGAVIANVRRRRRDGDLAEALRVATEALDVAPPSVRLQRAELLVETAELHVLLGDDAAADQTFAAAEGLAEGREPTIAIRAICGRAGIARYAGRLGDADALVKGAWLIAERTAALEPLTRSLLLIETGLCGLESRDPAAIADLDEAVALAASTKRGRRRDGIEALALEARATAHRFAGEFAPARAALDRALPLAGRAFGARSLEVAQCLNARGMVGKFSGEFERAAADYAAVGAILAVVVEPDHPEVAALLHNLAGLEHARGEFATAEDVARKSLELRILRLGDDHLQVGLDRSGLASILDGLGRRDEAEHELTKALSILRSTLGSEHREVGIALNNLAAIAQGRGDLVRAERHYREALAIKTASLGPGSPSVGITLANLASVVLRRGDPAGAGDLIGQALAILEATVGPDHAALRTARATRARIAARLDDEETG